MRLVAKKSLGQNFLQDKAVLQEILQAGEVAFFDVVVEVGPGTGFLTKALLTKVKQVIAIEKDEKLVDFLKKQDWFIKQKEKIELIRADILAFDLIKFLKQKNIQKYKLIANIPYYITGQFLRIFQEMSLRPEKAVLLVQKEVAERICAPKGKKSLLSIVGDYYGNCHLIREVKRDCFFPVPKVDSAILKIDFKKDNELLHPDKEKRKKFFHFLKIAFSSRRKTLANNLKVFWPKEEILKVLKDANLKERARPQDLDLADWEKIEKFFVS